MNIRIKYWHQDTLESGFWTVSGLMSLNEAKNIVASAYYPEAHIVKDEDGFPPLYKSKDWQE